MPYADPARRTEYMREYMRRDRMKHHPCDRCGGEGTHNLLRGRKRELVLCEQCVKNIREGL